MASTSADFITSQCSAVLPVLGQWEGSCMGERSGTPRHARAWSWKKLSHAARAPVLPDVECRLAAHGRQQADQFEVVRVAFAHPSQCGETLVVHSLARNLGVRCAMRRVYARARASCARWVGEKSCARVDRLHERARDAQGAYPLGQQVHDDWEALALTREHQPVEPLGRLVQQVRPGASQQDDDREVALPRGPLQRALLEDPVGAEARGCGRRAKGRGGGSSRAVVATLRARRPHAATYPPGVLGSDPFSRRNLIISTRLLMAAQCSITQSCLSFSLTCTAPSSTRALSSASRPH